MLSEVSAGSSRPEVSRRRTTNLLLVGGVLAIGVLNLCFAERINVSEGLGWDGDMYGRVALDFPDRIRSGQLDLYYARRILPSGVVHYGLRVVAAQMTVPNAILGFQWLNVAMLVATALAWCLAADQLKISDRGKWLGAVGLFVNFAVLKEGSYCPVLTDTTALAIAAGMMLAYVKRWPIRLAALTLAGAFTWPSLIYCGMILLVFPPSPCRTESLADRARLREILSALAAAGAVAAAAYVHYILGHRCTSWVVPPVDSLVPLSLLAVGAYVFLGGRPLAQQCLRIDERLFTAGRGVGLAAAAAIYVAAGTLADLAAGNVAMYTVGSFLKTTLETGIAKPLIFVVAHVVYYGPIVLLAILNWSACCRQARELGWGMPVLLAMGVAMSINSESRVLVTFLPFLVLVVVAALEGRGPGGRFFLVFVLISLGFSKIWLPFNIDLSPGDTQWGGFREWAHRWQGGPWMPLEAFIVQTVIVAAVGSWLYFSNAAASRRGLLPIALLSALILCPATKIPAAVMLDPSTDKSGEEWCYLAKSTTVIGVPFQPDVTQITFDGAVFTRGAELCFFYGGDDRPLLARAKTFLDGWIPVVQYAWREGDIAYDIEYFAAPLEGENADNTVNFVRVRMCNAGAAPATGKLAAAMRHSGGDYRNGGSAFSPAWQYAMTDSTVTRDGKLVYTFSPAPASAREAVPGTEYTAPFAGSAHSLSARSECCLVRYRRELQPGQSFAATFKMPRVPVADAAYNDKLVRADYSTCRTNIIAYWTALFQNTPIIELPEKRFQDAYRASLVHLLLGTRNRNGQKRQTDGLPYPDFFLTSVPEMAMMYLVSGLNQFPTDILIPNSIAQQQANGLYYDRAVAHGVIIPATQGHILYSIAQTVLFTQDKAFAEKIYPSMKKGVSFIEQSTAANPYGLLPRCYPYDAEMIDGHYTGQNLFALMGLRHAVRVARLLGKTEDVAAWTKLAQRYEAAILKGIDASAQADGYIPPGLYPYVTGPAARGGFAEYQTHCDWENMLLAYPTETLAAGDPRVKGTVQRVRKGYAEGIMTYRHGMHLHQYITSNMIEQYLAMGDTYTALKDFYHQLLHSGSTHESFENLVVPWTDRMVDPGCPPPHVWGTAKQGLMVRTFLLMEYGGQCGLQPGRRELRLFHCLSPAWVKPGQRVAIRNAPTEFGKITASMEFTPKGAEAKISATFHEPPAALRVRIPWFKELISFRTDATTSRQDGDCILISPNATWLSILWRDKPGAHLGTFEDLLTEYRKANSFEGVKDGRAIIQTHEPFLLDGEKRTTPQPLSFDLVREAFLHEYSRRAAESKKAGGRLITVSAPAMGGAGRPVIAANGWKITATDSLSDHGPELIADGVVELASSWQSASFPQTLTIDLRKPCKLKGVHVWPYWGVNRYYQYTVEVSSDGKKWTLVGDRRDNKKPATPEGERFEFAPTDTQFIRITMLHHSLNPGVHLVEVKTIEE